MQVGSVQNNNQSKYRGIATVAGGAVGALAGSALAPSKVGKISADEFLLSNQNQAAATIDRFGQTSGQRLAILYNDVNSSYPFKGTYDFDGKAKDLFNGQTEEKATIKSIVEKFVPEGKTLEDLAKEEAENKDQVGIATTLQRLVKENENAEVTKESLATEFKKGSQIFADAKKGVQEIIDLAPKQKGKFGVLGAVVGALILGIGAKVVSNLTKKDN